jgi:hypothetical protein
MLNINNQRPYQERDSMGTSKKALFKKETIFLKIENQFWAVGCRKIEDAEDESGNRLTVNGFSFMFFLKSITYSSS